jgi:hypothetical protein
MRAMGRDFAAHRSQRTLVIVKRVLESLPDARKNAKQALA